MEHVISALRKFRDERNWSKFHTPRNLAVSISIEAGEILEHFQWDVENRDFSSVDREALAGELADVLIYLLMLFDNLELDPADEAMKKIKANILRFPVGSQPGKRHC